MKYFKDLREEFLTEVLKSSDPASKKPNATTRHLRDYPVSDKDVAKPVKKPEKKKPEQGVAESTEQSLQKKIQAKRDALGLAREQRRARGQHQQGQREIKLQAEIDELSNQLTQMKKQGVAEGYTGRETKDGTWRVFKDGQAVAVAGPFNSRDEAHAWIKKHKQGFSEGFRVKEPSGNYRDPHTGRLYSSPDGKDGNDGYRTPEYMHDFYKKKLAQIAAGPYKRTKEVAQLRAKIAKLEKQGVAEGSLNELDTSTLKSYRGKANDEVNAIKQKQKLGQLSDKDFFKKQDRLMGITGASKRIVARGLAKEEKEFSTIQHYCAKHVYSDIFGEGIVLESEHAEPDNEGNIDWYTVQFNHGNEVVFTEDLDILIAEYHDNHKKKKKKNKDIQEKLHPNQKKLDVAEPKGKLTADDFHKLRAMKRKG